MKESIYKSSIRILIETTLAALVIRQALHFLLTHQIKIRDQM